MELQYCSSCNNYIYGNIYRGLDKSYCSEECRTKICIKIYQEDPQYQKPNKCKKSKTSLNIFEDNYQSNNYNYSDYNCWTDNYFIESIKTLWYINKIVSTVLLNTLIYPNK